LQSNQKLDSFIAMTLLIARKMITAVFGTMTLQLIEVFQYSVTYSMKQTSLFFLTVAMLSLISLCVTAALGLPQPRCQSMSLVGAGMGSHPIHSQIC